MCSLSSISNIYSHAFAMFHSMQVLYLFVDFQATAEANNLAAVANAKDLYNKEMEKVRSLNPFLLVDVSFLMQ
jgi:hypothetical protein